MLLDSCSYVTWSQDVPLGMRVIGHFEPLLQNKFFDPSTPSMRKGRDGEKLLFRAVICCSGGLYAVQGGYMLFRWVIWMFRGVICCSGGLYAENNDENSGHNRRCQSTDCNADRSCQ